jgi:hypothetical protein
MAPTKGPGDARVVQFSGTYVAHYSMANSQIVPSSASTISPAGPQAADPYPVGPGPDTANRDHATPSDEISTVALAREKSRRMA